MSILQTKLIAPPLHPDLVPRSRLTEKISRGIEAGNKLTLVAAPAGFGKSTTVSLWVKESSTRVAWLSLDNSENEPVEFWTYLIASIRAVLPDFGGEIFSVLRAASPAAVTAVLPGLLNELAALDQKIVLVLDDYHVIENQDIHNSISFLLDHQPRQIHLVIATRADPPLALARLRAQRTLAEIRADDLRFNNEETQQLLNEVLRLNLSPQEIELLETRTEGWGVGLLLAAQSLQGRSDKSVFITEFSGTQQFILEYLVEEVLNYQTAATRKFLLQTSILDRFCAPLCNDVTGNSEADGIINHLRVENLFIIPLDQNQTWYRYHHLFADLLKNILKKEIPHNEFLDLHRRASQWYLDARNIHQAINYALSGEDYRSAADLIDKIIDEIISQGKLRTLEQWIAMIPERVIRSRPRLLMHHGWTLFLSGNVNQAALILNAARDNLDSLEDLAERNLLNGQLSALLATITALTRDVDGAINQAKGALDHLPEDEFIYRARAMRAWGVSLAVQGYLGRALEKLSQAQELALRAQNKFLVSEILSQIATVRKHQGKYSSAAETYQQILGLYESPQQAPPACIGYTGLAHISLERNDLEEAETLLNHATELSQKGNIGYVLQAVYMIGGLLKCAQGDCQAALETIQKGESASRMGGGSLEGMLGIAWFQARLNLLCGDLEAARRWAEGNLTPVGWSYEGLPVVLDEMYQSLLALVYLNRGDYEKVLEIYDRVCVPAENGGRLSRVAELNLFKAVALMMSGRDDEALSPFEKSLRLAAPEGIIRLYLEAGPAVIDLIKMLKDGDKYLHFTRKLLAAFNVQLGKLDEKEAASRPRDSLIDPLTERELEVLRLICDGYSNQQIADLLVVSVNTVKKHTSNIYSKLGVRNRAQAVIRSSEYGLI